MAGNIQRRPDGKWRARYRDANHREHARHFPRKRDAEQWLASQEVAIARGEWVDPTLSKITVGEWLPRWLALQVQLKQTTMVRYEVALRRQILPRWELVPLSRITHSDVSSWVHGLTDEGLAPATVRYAHRVLSLALTAAVRDGRLVRNVAEGVPLPRVVATPKRFLTHDQVQALAEACVPYGTLIRVLAYAGLRWGELGGPDRLPDRPGQAPDRGRRSDHRSSRSCGRRYDQDPSATLGSDPPLPGRRVGAPFGREGPRRSGVYRSRGRRAAQTSGRGSSIRLRRRSDCLD
jgi:hypothetical protein